MHGSSSSSADGKKKARIEIIPLIDVVFFLLATFVLFTLSLDRIRSLPVDLPYAGNPPPGPPPEVVNIQISDAGVYWNKELISMAELKAHLDNYVKTEKDPKILVTTDERGSFGDAVTVLDEIRLIGIQKVSVDTRGPRPTGK